MATTERMVTGTDFVMVATQDIDGAVDFYENVLGLERGKQWGQMPAHEFETGNLTIAVMQPDAFGMEFQPSNQAIVLRVDDVAAARERLESKGVEFQTDIIDSGVCHQCYFQDPDGNAIGIHHRYAPSD